MIVVPQPKEKDAHLTLSGVTWQTFKTLLAEIGEDRACRITYNEEVLEFRMPLQEHEKPKILLGSFIEGIADELEIEVMQLGSWSLKREDLRSFIEPDTCFYIQNESRVRGRTINLDRDPPPDLAIESDYTHSSINKQSIYAALGIPELWRYSQRTLFVYHLIANSYQQQEESLAFPFLPIAEIPDFIEQSDRLGQRSAVRLFRQRIREILNEQ
ncbi:MULTISPECIES: Uma2 family endonuclease [Spirulina sp. CCY15215]|uniref:Uma2 family endonuclease n=1 Tax=Spirulina sp. CCY15215 TaxID=2767591 RepID=UPI00194F8237|nr:Uma2 family endonuclease [Spirulina major]